MRTLVVITGDLALTVILDRLLKDSYRLVSFPKLQTSLDFIYNSFPDMMIVDVDAADPMRIERLNEFKSDPIFGQMPILAVFENDYLIPDWNSIFVEDYIRRKDIEPEILKRIELCLLRNEKIVEVNPLTRLPGNISINRQIQKRLDRAEVFTLAYADLDNFKPYNDKYGFGRGDEVLKMLGRLMLNTVKNRQPVNSFVGHIGGDDFVYIMDPLFADETASSIISTFSSIIPTFYDAEDRVRKHIESVDREGHNKSYPLITISIGGTNNRHHKFSHYGEMAEVASEMKKHAKCSGGSCYSEDRRKKGV